MNDPTVNDIIKRMVELVTMFTVPTVTMKDGEIITTGIKWTDEKANQIYNDYGEILKEYLIMNRKEFNHANRKPQPRNL